MMQWALGILEVKGRGRGWGWERDRNIANGYIDYTNLSCRSPYYPANIRLLSEHHP